MGTLLKFKYYVTSSFLLILCVLIRSSGSLRSPMGKPLILTPYINSGDINKARALSFVNYFKEFKSYSGFFTTHKNYGSNLFFWFFPSVYNEEKAPLLLWLNGGPGSSSLFGLFVENGPLAVDDHYVLKTRMSTSWILTNNVLYIDSPVGTGFSFTKNESGYAKSMDDIIEGLYDTLIQFLVIFPEMKTRDFYITGESYAGKYIPNLAYRILQENYRISNPPCRINLKGISIGNGFIDPLHSLNYSSFLFDMGLLDSKTKETAEQREEIIKDWILQKQWRKAFEEYDDYIGYSGKKDNFISEVTGLQFYYNILVEKRPIDYDSYIKFLDRREIRQALHVGHTPFDKGTHVMSILRGDIMKSEKHVLEFLLNNGLRILLYNGQLDMIVPNRLTDDFVKTLKWFGIKEFLKTRRQIWRVNDQVAGYYTSHLNFTRLLIRDCGHMVPYDKPKWAFKMINAFTSGKF